MINDADAGSESVLSVKKGKGVCLTCACPWFDSGEGKQYM